MRITLATLEDIDDVVRFRRESIEWLRTQGTDQWSADFPDTETMISGFARALAAGQTWFAVDDDGGQVLGMVTVNDETATGLWSQEEERTALFVHRLTVDRRAAGQRIGSQLLDYAGVLAQKRNRDWLRLDAWTTNARLHRYYLSQGFLHVRTVKGHHTPSAAIFERPASYHATPARRRDLGPDDE